MTTARSLGKAALAAAVVAACAATVACSPALDWRTARPDGGAVEILFPCRPSHDARRVRLDGIDTAMRMESCHAAGSTFSLAVADAADAAQVQPLVQALRTAAVANIDGAATTLSLAIPGAAPNPAGGRLRIAGHRSDRRPVAEDAVFFVRGVHVYQASVLGEAFQPEAADIFIGSIRVSR